MKVLGELNSRYERDTRAAGFAEICRCLALGRGKTADAIEYARTLKNDAILKAVEGTIDGWGEPLAPYGIAFLDSLGPHGGFYDTALNSGAQTAPLRTRLTYFAAFSTGSEFASPGLKVVSEFQLDQTQLDGRTAHAMFVATAELIRLSGASGGALLQRGLQVAVASATDLIFINAIIAASGAPIPSSNDPGTDIALLLEALDLRAGSRVLVGMNPILVKRIAALTTADGLRRYPTAGIAGGAIMPGVQLLPSDQIPLGTILAIDSAQLIGNRGTIVPAGSNSGTVDLAAGESGGPEVISLFQKNMLSVRLERFFGFSIPNDRSIATMENANYVAS